eukprot:TRINITY_DN41472_c0_g1_i1.p1 TRINITY_DN41472_c0_g1~~TRINITY_DN41472_c0_g1_i1.p1  ORF type:complete len:609 (+),score=121.76 TRINITY_DN41472_c0_g1_i1:64-1890(+)
MQLFPKRPWQLLFVLLVAGSSAEDSQLDRLGVNFAIPSKGANPSELAQKAAALGITKIKLFDYSTDTIYHLRKYYTLSRKKLEIMVGFPQWIASPPDGHGARNTTNVKELLKTIRDNSDIVVGVFVYNEPCINGFCAGTAGEEYFSLMNYLADELKDEGKVVTTPFSMGDLLPRPPHGVDMLNRSFVARLVNVLAKTKAPATINVYPYLDYIGSTTVGLQQALGNVDNSQIDFDLKSIRDALNSLGSVGVNTPIAIGETGWAHDFGEDPGKADYWKRRVFEISNYEHSNNFYTNLANKMPWYVKNWNVQSIFIFGLADELYKPMRSLQCVHGQPIEEWIKYQCGAYSAEKYFGVTGLWKDVSKSPWNKGGSNMDKSAAAKMRTQDWPAFYGEQGRLGWVLENQQGEAAWSAEETVQRDLKLLEEHGGLKTVLEKDKQMFKAYKAAHPHEEHDEVKDVPQDCMDCFTMPTGSPAGDKCYNAIQYAKTTGIDDHPEWYPGLSKKKSSDAEFQMQIFKSAPDTCFKPCTVVSGSPVQEWQIGSSAGRPWQLSFGQQLRPQTAAFLALAAAGLLGLVVVIGIRRRQAVPVALLQSEEAESLAETGACGNLPE